MNTLYVYGGSFNPPHIGHLEVIKTVSELLQPEDKFILMPSFQSPLKKFDYDPGGLHRIKMIKSSIKKFNVEVEDHEISLSKKSYTIESIPFLQEKYQAEAISLVIGFDQLNNFQRWKDFDKILQSCNLVVLSRQGFDSSNFSDLDENLLELVEKELDDTIILKTGNTIKFIQMNDIDVSSSEIRRSLLKDEDVSNYMDEETLKYINDTDIYKASNFKVDDYLKFAKECRSILEEKNAARISVYDVREITQPSEFNIIASGLNTRHTSALAEFFIKEVRKTKRMSPIAVEGLSEGRWVVIDYGALIVHIFYDFVRNEYLLEELWAKGKEIT